MQTILRNNDNRLLTNSEGRILKANFDFGNGLTGNRSGRIEVLSTLTDYSALLYIRHDVTSVNHKIQGLQGGVEKHYNYNTMNTNNLTAEAFISVEGTITRSSIFSFVPNTKYFIAYTLGAAGRVIQGNNRRAFVGTPAVIATDAIRLQSMPACYFLVFNRQLSTSEINYVYNNGLGNEPLTVNGLIAEIRFNMAEILPVPDRVNGGMKNIVGFRDFSGAGNHLQLEGLPATTQQEQVNVVNSTWLTLS